MNCWKQVAVLVIAGLIAGAAPTALPAQDTNPDPIHPKLTDQEKGSPAGLPPGMEAEDVARAIMEIREQIGPVTDWSLLTEQARATPVEPQPSRIEPASPNPGAKPGNDRAAVFRAMGQLSRAGAADDRATGPGPNTVRPAMDSAQRLVFSLRLAARQLDDLAAEFEDSNEYQLADHYRHEAKELREMARHRQSAKSPSGNPGYPTAPTGMMRHGEPLPIVAPGQQKNSSVEPRFWGVDAPRRQRNR